MTPIKIDYSKLIEELDKDIQYQIQRILKKHPNHIIYRIEFNGEDLIIKHKDPTQDGDGLNFMHIDSILWSWSKIELPFQQFTTEYGA